MIKDSNERIAITMKKTMLERLEKESEFWGMSTTAIINIALIEWLEKHSKSDTSDLYNE